VTGKREAIAPQPALVPSKTNISTEAAVALPHPGLVVFEEQKCATCHSLSGKGNPRYPLDGIGSRMIAGELEQWITATGPAQEKLSSMVVRRKERYRTLSPPDMTALVEYLGSLRAENHSTEVP
jgi:mono/diheme cytochrome c family protein